jgi:hypothetical protein
MLTRIGPSNADRRVAAARGVLHGAMALYLTRYLNVPPARIPGDNGDRLDDLPADQETIRDSLLDAFDRQRQVDLTARLAARHLTLRHSTQALIATLAHAVLAKTRAFTPIRCSRRESGRSQYGATRTRLGTSSLRLPGILPRTHRRSARRCRPLTSPGV